MQVSVAPGKYIVAVSGGVDSVVLLDVLRRQPGLELVVAHFDHGIRPDSAEDAAFVRKLAGDLPFVSERAELGARASEAVARVARYDFLRRVQHEHGAAAIITAHHQDDLVETAVLNMLRGTGRRGLTALDSRQDLLRPLLDIPKSDLVAYALKHNISWREDSTNHDQRYTRNAIRAALQTHADGAARDSFLARIDDLKLQNETIDGLLDELVTVHSDTNGLDRQWFASLPHVVAKEVLATWLRSQGRADYDRKRLERLTVHVKTKRSGARLDAGAGASIVLTNKHLALDTPER